MKVIRTIGKNFLRLLVILWLALAVYAYWPTGIEEVPAEQLASADDRFVTVDGLSLRYREYGQPSADVPSVLLIHGFGNSLQSFRDLAPMLGEQAHVVAVDMPGFGLSSKPADWEYSNANQARMMSELVKALELDAVVVGGHSLGGAVALRLALIEPAISGLILFNPGIINTGVPRIAEYYFWPLQRLSAKQFGNRDFRENFLKQSYVDPEIVTPQVMDNLMLTVRSEGYMAGMTKMMGQYSAATESPLLQEVTVPTLIVWGVEDRNKNAAELAALQTGLSRAPKVETLKVQGAGHYVHEEAPEVVAEGILAAHVMVGAARL